MKHIMKKSKLIGMIALMVLGLSIGACTPQETPPTKAPQNESDLEEERRSLEAEIASKEAEEESIQKEKGLSVEALQLFDTIKDWRFCFESGAGVRETTLTIDEQGHFSGEYYDNDAGDVGEGYEGGTIRKCDFTGRFTDVVRMANGAYVVTVKDLTYEKEPGEEEIIGGVRYVYQEAYGISGTEILEIYLPGTQTAKIPKEYVDSVKNMHFGVNVSGQYYINLPLELPFCGIYNPTTEYGFSSENVSGANLTYLVNRASFPGLTSIREDFHDWDGTYYYQDMSADGLYMVFNHCFIDEKKFNLMIQQEEFANDCIAHVMEGQPYREVTYLDPTDADSAPDLSYVTGGGISMVVSWLAGDEEDTRFYVARFTKYGRFVYAYGYSSGENDELLQGEAGSFFLSSLTFSGSREKISSASTDKVAKKIHAMVINNGSSPSMIYADEVVLIHLDDKELMEKYHLTEEDFMNDYVIVGMDKDYQEYQLSESCPIYGQFPGEGPFSELQSKSAFHQKLMDGQAAYLMELYLDEDNNVTFLYEPFRP